ncbi:peptidase domain-containing ABC transporter [Lysobacter rhizosphaerae]
MDLRELRSRFSLSLKGATLDQLVRMAARLNLQARPLRLEPDELPKLRMPCVLHWDLNHVVVLVKATRKSVIIHDPAVGRRRLNHDEVSKHFTGVALELTPSMAFQKHKVAAPSVSLGQLMGQVTGFKRAMFQIILLSLALQVFALVAPMLMQGVMDQVLVTADRDLLLVIVLGFVLMLVLQLAIGQLRSWSLLYLSTSMGLQWMGSVFAHLLRLPLEFFEKRHLGDITSRTGSVGVIQDTLTRSFIEVLPDGLMAVATLLMMMRYSPRLAGITLAAVTLYLLLRVLAYPLYRRANEEQPIRASKENSHFLESIRGVQSLKVAGKEIDRHSAWQNLVVDSVNQHVRIEKMNMVFGTSSQLLFGLERIVVIWLGSLLVLENQFSIGMLVAYLSYKDQFSGRIGNLIDTGVRLRVLRLHGERLADIVLTPPEEDYALPDISLPGHPRIVVDNLSFRYADGEPWVLRDCSFIVEPGEAVALTGASGCGKTTLVKLMLGLMKPTEGTISVGGHDLHKLGPRSVRTIVGAVMQDDQLFAGSIADNISFFDSGADPTRIEASARLAAVHDEIAAMPMGYYSLIGDMGSSLSGGQKQRVILARALYRSPRLLFLDEATSHLDVTNERLVNDAVHQLRLTKVIVAHRPETIASADRVLLMEQGRIVQDFRPQAHSAAAASTEERHPASSLAL